MKTTLSILFAGLLLISCNSEQKTEEEVVKTKADYVADIKTAESQLSDVLDINKKRNESFALITAYTTFADSFQRDTMAPDYLFKAAEIALALDEPQMAAQKLLFIEKNYKEYSKYPETLFMLGFVYETKYRELGKASSYYNRVVNDYPNNDFADDAEASIKTLGMTDEELIEHFKKLNKDREAEAAS